MGNRIVFEIGVKNASDLASKSQQAGAQAGQAFNKGFNAQTQITGGTRKWLQGLSPKQLDNVLKSDPGIRDALVAEYMGSFSGLGKATYASAGGQEFPIEKNAKKFGASAKQLRQGLSELNPALKEFKRLMTEGMRGMSYELPHTSGRFPFFPGLEPEKLLQQGVKRALGMGQLRTGNPIILPSDKFLQQGAKSLMGMGQLQTQQIDWKKLMYGVATAGFSPWVAAREIAGSGVFGGGGGGGGKGFGIWGAAGFEGFMKSFLLLQAVTRTLTMSFRELQNAVQQGSKLYQQSAAMGMNPAKLSQLQTMFTGIGLSPELAMRMMTQARMGSRKAGVFTGVNDMAMRAQVNGASIEEVQQIKNMGNELQWLAQHTKFATSVLGDTAGSMQRIAMEGVELKTTWTAMWQQTVDIMEPLILATEKFAVSMMDLVIVLEKGLKLFPTIGNLSAADVQKLIGLISGSGTGPGKSLYPAGLTHATPEGAFARIGFTFGNYGGGDYARQTAVNTKRIADAVTRGGSGRGGWSEPLFPAHNMP